MRILFVGNLRLRGYGDIGINCDRKLYYGLVKTGHYVWEFSDRDIAVLDSPLGIKPLGRAAANRRLIETCANVVPDLLVLSLCDIIRTETLAELRRQLPSLQIAHVNVDPLFYEENNQKILDRLSVCHSLFVTTAGPRMRRFAQAGRLVSYLPNATDPGSEYLDNSQQDRFDHDLVYFGVGRPSDERWKLVSELPEHLGDLRFAAFGSHGGKKIDGRAREAVLERAMMGLNLNRQEGEPLYSSDRIAMLMPNGLVTFISARSGLQRFFSNDEAVFFQDAEDIARAAKALKADDERRRAIASAGRAKYRRLFDGAIVARYIVEAALGLPLSHDYAWADEVVRA